MNIAIPTLRHLSRACTLALWSLWLSLSAVAPAAAQADDADPPGRVGRLSDVSGQVWLYAPDEGEWVAAARNRPLTTGNRLATDPGAHAEVRIGSSIFRLDSGSELEVARLDDGHMVFELHGGSLSARLRSGDALREFELRTGEGRFTAQRTGRYRFDRLDETSHLTVYSGQALHEGAGSALTVYSDQRGEFWLDAAGQAQYSITEPRQDGFAAWNHEQDRRDERSASARHVSPEMTGVEELDRHGRWDHSDEFGTIWFPRGVASGWAPYSVGHWAWISPWGWTWVDDAEWGFAPFHYGRWVWYRNAWAWAPGRYVRRPVYAPALVAWIGGPRLSVSINIGGGGPGVGWFPLAPREVYVPGHRFSPRYVRGLNANQGVPAAQIDRAVNRPFDPDSERDYRNRKQHHAVTMVPAQVFAGRQPVGPAAAQWRHAAGPGAADARWQALPVLRAAPVTAPAFPGRGRDPRTAAAEQRGQGAGPAFAPARPVAGADRERRPVAGRGGDRSEGRYQRPPDGRRDEPREAHVPREPRDPRVWQPRGRNVGSPREPATDAAAPGAVAGSPQGVVRSGRVIAPVGGEPPRPEGSRRPMPPRPEAGGPSGQAGSQAPAEPRLRGRPVNPADQAPRPGGSRGTAPAVPAPVAAAPAAERGERGAPDRHHHGPRGEAPAAPQPKAVAPRPQAPEDRSDRPDRGANPRDRKMAQ